MTTFPSGMAIVSIEVRCVHDRLCKDLMDVSCFSPWISWTKIKLVPSKKKQPADTLWLNSHRTMENHHVIHVLMSKSTSSTGPCSSYVTVPEAFIPDPSEASDRLPVGSILLPGSDIWGSPALGAAEKKSEPVEPLRTHGVILNPIEVDEIMGI